jgi:Peptidase_C39 like family
MLRLIERPGQHALLRVPPSTRALVSWNGDAPSGGIALSVHRTDGSVAEPLLFARWSPSERRSLDGADAATRIAVDVVRSEIPFSGIGVTSTVPLDAIAVSVPPHGATRAPVRTRVAPLDVPPLSQSVPGHPESRRRWCSPTALTMLLRFHGVQADIASVARAVFDTSYDGTGNWAFNVAYAGARGLRAVVCYLRGIDHVAAFLEAGLPVAISIAWSGDELPGAPLAHSDGHLIVVRGFENGTVLVNDPAQRAVATRYDRAALDRVFRNHGGVAYLVAPRERTNELVTLANGGDHASTTLQ